MLHLAIATFVCCNFTKRTGPLAREHCQAGILNGHEPIFSIVLVNDQDHALNVQGLHFKEPRVLQELVLRDFVPQLVLYKLIVAPILVGFGRVYPVGRARLLLKELVKLARVLLWTNLLESWRPIRLSTRFALELDCYPVSLNFLAIPSSLTNEQVLLLPW